MHTPTYAAALAAALLASAPALAAAQNNTGADNGTMSAAQQQAEHDFSKFSQDGMKAFQDIDNARLEIFEAQTGKAKQDVQEAQALLQKAQSDNTVFMKAESELKAPPGQRQRSSGANATPSATQVAWLPINSSMVIDEDYLGNPGKAAGVNEADKNIQNGDKKQAMDALKLHDVDVSFIVQAAPLQATIQGVSEAASDMQQGHYFAANAALKKVDDGVRLDDESYVGTPKNQEALNNTANADKAVKSGQ